MRSGAKQPCVRSNASRRIASCCCRSIRNSRRDRKSTRLNSSHLVISYAVFCLKKKKILLSEGSFRRKKLDAITAMNIGEAVSDLLFSGALLATGYRNGVVGGAIDTCLESLIS